MDWFARIGSPLHCPLWWRFVKLQQCYNMTFDWTTVVSINQFYYYITALWFYFKSRVTMFIFSSIMQSFFITENTNIRHELQKSLTFVRVANDWSRGVSGKYFFAMPLTAYVHNEEPSPPSFANWARIYVNFTSESHDINAIGTSYKIKEIWLSFVKASAKICKCDERVRDQRRRCKWESAASGRSRGGGGGVL